MDKEIREKEARVGEGMHGQWVATLEAENSHKKKLDSKVIMFEKTLEFKAIIMLCYGKQKTLSLQQ